MNEKIAVLPRSADLPWLRHAVQALFLAIIILTGVQVHHFVRAIEKTGVGPLPPRPAGVEGFLPISSLMGLVHLLKTGVANTVHPAGLVLFTLTLALAVAVRRGFCSWVCPIGTLSEYAWRLGARIFGRNPRMPRFLDIPLQGLKFLLLGFFLFFIVRMSGAELCAFTRGPYNRIADVKMYLFFAHISSTALAVVMALLALSVVFKNFWCRYLCPYGGLLGLLSLVSPTAVKRDAGLCIGCGGCSCACPNLIDVKRKSRVNSTECMACYSCIHACPRAGALSMNTGSGRRAVSAAVYGFITVAAFLLAANAASAFNYWQTETPPEAYRYLYQHMEAIPHPGPVSE